jgi:hypothetical protein
MKPTESIGDLLKRITETMVIIKKSYIWHSRTGWLPHCMMPTPGTWMPLSQIGRMTPSAM